MPDSPPFPPALWGKTHVSFLPAGISPPPAPIRAALVFAIQGSRFVVGDITGRGWCIPGGALEAGETPEQAARREAFEETGAILGPLRFLGHFHLDDGEAAEIVPTFAAEAVRLDTLPPATESRGVRLLSLDELPRDYYMWDALLEAVFRYALAQDGFQDITV